MLFYGDRLPQPVPVRTSVWHWIFNDALPNCPFNCGREGGFRDARTQEFLSYARVQTEATHLSTALAQRFRMGADSHVAIFCQNSVWYPVVNFAAIRIGTIVTASSPDYEVDEIVHVLKTSEADLVYADASSWRRVVQAAEKRNIPADRIIYVGDRSSEASACSAVSLHDLIRDGQAQGPNGQVDAWQVPAGQSNCDIPAYLSFTSGTTSLPKGVMVSHHNVIAQLMQMRALTSEDCPTTLLAVLPFYHITGVVQLLQLPLALNQHVICISKFNMQEMLKVIEHYRCDELWLVPPLLIRLVHDPVAIPYTLDYVRQFNTGAAPLAKEIINKLAAKFPHVRLRQAWGMTESCSALTLSRPSEQTYDKAHTVGRAVPETVIKIIDPDYEGPGERVLGPGQSGEVLAKGPQVTMGYYHEARATAETFDKDGFLHTGDIGFVDTEGYLQIHDRLKEMVKVKGVAVAPAEIENLLLGHATVADAAVIGIPDAYSGEVLKAFVVPKDYTAQANPQTAKLLTDYVKQTKSRPKWLTGGLDFLEVIPKSASGKVLRRVLRAQETAKAQQKAKL